MQKISWSFVEIAVLACVIFILSLPFITFAFFYYMFLGQVQMIRSLIPEQYCEDKILSHLLHHCCFYSPNLTVFHNSIVFLPHFDNNIGKYPKLMITITLPALVRC